MKLNGLFQKDRPPYYKYKWIKIKWL